MRCSKGFTEDSSCDVPYCVHHLSMHVLDIHTISSLSSVHNWSPEEDCTKTESQREDGFSTTLECIESHWRQLRSTPFALRRPFTLRRSFISATSLFHVLCQPRSLNTDIIHTPPAVHAEQHSSPVCSTHSVPQSTRRDAPHVLLEQGILSLYGIVSKQKRPRCT